MDPAALSQAVPESARKPAVVAAWVAAWLACLAVAASRLDHARTEFGNRSENPRECRADGNSGPTEIDFGGQFLMGRMLATGHGRELYHRQALWPVVWASYPQSAEAPQARDGFPTHLRPAGERDRPLRHDAENLMVSVMGADAPEWTPAAAAATLPTLAGDPLTAAILAAHGAGQLTPDLVAAVNTPAVGGPLYPPVHAFLYAPLTLTNDPPAAYAAFQWLSLALTFTAGLAIRWVARGRVWWPVATLAVLLFPGYLSGLDLGQNQVVTLNILLWGWVLLASGRDGWAGFAWGLLAFKPVWAVAFLAVPLVMGRWRMLAAMCATGGAAVLLTLPVVGVQTWLDWLAVGGEATATYNVNENWITLSRDLTGVVRRVAIDFTKPAAERDAPAIHRVAAALLLTVVATTAVVYRLRRTPGRVTGTAAGFLTLGAYLCCYRFMYYDALLGLFPIAVLAAAPRRLAGGVYRLRPASGQPPCEMSASVNGVVATALGALLLCDNFLRLFTVEFTAAAGAATSAARVSANTSIYMPLDTAIFLTLWAALAVTLLARGDDGEPALPAAEGVEGQADVRGAHERLADQDRVDAVALEHP